MKHVPVAILSLLLGFTAAGLIGAFLEKINEATRYEEMQQKELTP